MCPRPLDPSLIPAKNALADTIPWLWLIEVSLSDAETLYLVTGTDAVTFGGNTYEARGVTIQEITDDAKGNIGTASVTVANPGHILTKLILDHGGLDDRRISLKTFYDGTVGFELAYAVSTSSISSSLITFSLGQERVFEAAFPARQTFRTCDWSFGDPNTCQYDRLNGNLKTCDLTLLGENGCVAHGQDEADRAVTVNHPRVFGGQFGMIRDAR